MGEDLRLAAGVAALGLSAAAAAACPGETTAEVRRCLSDELGRMQLELESVLVKAREEATEAAVLDKAQVAWRHYMETDCRAAADVYRGGTLAPVVELSCRLDHVKARMQHLRGDYLQRDGLAPGRR